MRIGKNKMKWLRYGQDVLHLGDFPPLGSNRQADKDPWSKEDQGNERTKSSEENS